MGVVTRLMLLLTAACFSQQMYRAQGVEVRVGGNAGTWTIGVKYAPLEAQVGDTVVFNYARGQHNVVQISSPSCSLPGAKQVAGLTDTPFTLQLNQSGTFHYACSVEGHCDAGMLLTINVGATPAFAPGPAPASAPTVSFPQTAQMSFHEGGRCTEATAVPGYNDTFTTVCLSPPLPLAPSQVINDFYLLPNPYPDAVVAVINQTAQLVDESNRPVPLSEVYVHHFFGDGRFVLGEGAELRGSMQREPLPAPYYYFVNGTYFDDQLTRATNIHVINTKGVSPFNIPPCIECWCRNYTEAADQDYYGGTACCTPLNCESELSTNGTSHSTYYLQFNVTYSYPEAIGQPKEAHLQLLEITDGNVEYDVHRGEPGSQDLKNLTTTVDKRCPQTKSYGILRCTGHIHIGGICMEMYDAATDSLICSSCAQYGNSSSVSTTDEEHGYLVKMTDDTLLPPVELQPGQEIRLVSRYDSSIDHYGVMGFMILTLTDWDPSCPAKSSALATTQDISQYDLFTTFIPPGGNVAESFFST